MMKGTEIARGGRVTRKVKTAAARISYKTLSAIIFITLLTALLLPGQSNAFRAISLQMERSIAVEPGKSATLNVLFFDIDTPEGIPVSLAFKAPPGWQTALSEKEFLLMPSDKETGDVYYALGDSYVRAHRVTMHVSVPFDAQERAYALDLYATLHSSSNSTIKVNQERHMNFKIRVAKPLVPAQNIIQQILESIPKTITGFLTQLPVAISSASSSLLLVALAALVAIYLYKGRGRKQAWR